MVRTPKGCEDYPRALAPLQGANNYSLATGGLRCASTSGYYLATLRVAKRVLHLTLAGVPKSEHFLFTLRLNSCTQRRMSCGGLLSKQLEGGLRSFGYGAECQTLTHRFLDADLGKPRFSSPRSDPHGHVRPRPDVVCDQKVRIDPGKPGVGPGRLLNAVKHFLHRQLRLRTGRVVSAGVALLDHADRPFSQVARVDELDRVGRFAGGQDLATAIDAHRPIGEAISFIAGPDN